MGRLDDMQTAVKPFEKKLKYICMIILGLAESLKARNRSDRTRLGPTVTLFDGLFLRDY